MVEKMERLAINVINKKMLKLYITRIDLGSDIIGSATSSVVSYSTYKTGEKTVKKIKDIAERARLIYLREEVMKELKKKLAEMEKRRIEREEK
jgi:hypothetical protein